MTLARAWAKCHTCGKEAQLPRGKNCKPCTSQARWKREAKKRNMEVTDLAAFYYFMGYIADWMWQHPRTVMLHGLD